MPNAELARNEIIKINERCLTFAVESWIKFW